MRPKLQISRSTQIFIGLTFAYLALSFLLPASIITKAEYNLTDSQYHFLLFTVRLPIVALWCIVFYAYRQLFQYAQKIKFTPEGKDFATLARGMQWIAWGLPIPALIAVFLNAITNVNPGFLTFALIAVSYCYVVVALVAFSYIGTAAHGLSKRADVHISSKYMRLFLAALVLLSVLFCYLIGSKLHNVDPSNSFNIYYLPTGIVWATIVAPYLYAWFIGLFAALQIALTAQRITGVIYHQALTLLAFGIVTVIISMVAMQYFRSIIPRVGHLTIGAALMTTYFIYAINALGCALLVVGVKRLKRIEEV